MFSLQQSSRCEINQASSQTRRQSTKGYHSVHSFLWQQLLHISFEMTLSQLMESKTSTWIVMCACIVVYAAFCDTKSASQTVVGVALVFSVVYFVYNAVQYVYKIWCIGQEVDKLPGEPKHWLYGNLHQFGLFGEARLRFNTEMAKKYNKVMRVWLGPNIPSVSCMHPDTVKLILRTNQPKISRGKKFASPWIGDSLALSEGKKWARNRRLLTPAFHFDVLKPYVQVYNEAADILIRKWNNLLPSDGSIDVCYSVSLCTLNIILRCAFSYEEDVQLQGGNNPYVSRVGPLLEEISTRAISILNNYDFVYYRTRNGKRFMENCQFVHKVAHDIIAKRKNDLDNSAPEERSRYLDFLDILLLVRDEEDNGLTDSEIRQEVDTFLFAGYETTSSAIAWCLYALAGHPEHQSKVREELMDAVGSNHSDTLDWDAANGLPYLTRCVKESLRLYTTVPFVSRELNEPMTIEEVRLQPGTVVQANIWALHHNEHVWGPDHMEFNPERFLPENVERMDSFAFIPFSAGLRNCIGQHFAMHEIKIVVGRILLAFQLTRDYRHSVEMVSRLTLNTKDGIKLFFKSVDNL